MAQGSLKGWIAGLGVGLLATSLLVSCTPDGEVPPTRTTSPAVDTHVNLTVVVYGPKPVTTTWRRAVDTYVGTKEDLHVEVTAYPDETTALAAVRKDAADGHAPDLFLAGVDSLPVLMGDRLVQPVDELLGDRQVDFGDGFTRSAIEGFSRDNALQCMPVEYSPLVVYYNPALVNLTAAQGPSPTPIAATQTWTMEQFASAARVAARRGHLGLYVAPTLDQVAPFLWSAGGGLVDNTEAPTSLTLGSSGSVSALAALIALVRDRTVSLPTSTPQVTAVTDFEKGRLAMILGYRDLTGDLRAHGKVPFNVLPMPKLGAAATSGSNTGMCLSRTSSNAPAAADLLTYLVSPRPMKLLARTGYVMPSNLAASASNAFWQPTKMPAASNVFTEQVRNIEPLPTTEQWGPVARYAEARLRNLLRAGSPVPDVDVLTARMRLIDTVSQRMLEPPSPSATPSGD